MKTSYLSFCSVVAFAALFLHGCECRAGTTNYNVDPVHVSVNMTPHTLLPVPNSSNGVFAMALVTVPPTNRFPTNPPPAISIGFDWNNRTNLLASVRVLTGHASGSWTHTSDIPLTVFSNAPSPVVTLSPVNVHQPLVVEIELLATNGFYSAATPELWLFVGTNAQVYGYNGGEWIGFQASSNFTYTITDAITSGSNLLWTAKPSSNCIVGVKLPADPFGFFKVETQ